MTESEIYDLIEIHAKQAESDRARFNDHVRIYRGDVLGQKGNPFPTGTVQAFDNGDDDNTDRKVNVNYSYPFVDTMVASICPTEPAVTVNADEPGQAPAAAAREKFINWLFSKLNVYEKVWLAATKAGIFPSAYVKVVWDPARFAPNIRVLDPRFFWHDPVADDWEHVRYTVEAHVMSRQEIINLGVSEDVVRRMAFNAFPNWFHDKQHDRSSTVFQGTQDILKWILVYEVHDYSSEQPTFYKFVQGMREPFIKGPAPYKYVRNCYYQLKFNNNLDDNTGLSDSQLIQRLQNELNELETLQLWSLLSSIPFMVVDKSKVENYEDFLHLVRNVRGPGEIAGVDLINGVKIDEAVTWSTTPTQSPNFAGMADRFKSNIEYILALPQYARGGVGNSDVATEVQLADNATKTRNGKRQKAIHKMIGWMAETCMELYAEYMPEETTINRFDPATKTYNKFNREVLDFPPLDDEPDPQSLKSIFSGPSYGYGVVAHSALEQTKMVQLRLVRENWPLIQTGIQSGVFDAMKIYVFVSQLMGLDGVLTKEQGDPAVATANLLQTQMGVPPSQQPNPQGGAATPDEMTGAAISAGKQAFDAAKPMPVAE